MKSVYIAFILSVAAAGGRVWAEPPPLPVEQAFGVNVHTGSLFPGDPERIRAAGFTWVRVDLDWDGVERQRGVYNFAAFDALVAQLHAAQLRALVILDYGNRLYGDVHDAEAFSRRSTTDEFRRAYAAFSAAAVSHYAGRGFIWEQWNEPNNKHSWPPSSDSAAYIALARAAAIAIRQRAPEEVLVGPATSEVDLKFIEACVRGGMLEYWSAVSVHPYRQTEPETAARDYIKLRSLLARSATAGRVVPILCGEWGYSTAWRGFSEAKQAEYITRVFQVSREQSIPLTIWYDWRDDGENASDPELRFGLVRFAADQAFHPKPAYFAAQRFLGQRALVYNDTPDHQEPR